jgi:hypothetical protein
MDGWQGDAKGEIKLIYSVPRIIYVKVSMYMYTGMFVSCVQLCVYSLYIVCIHAQGPAGVCVFICR